MFGGSSSPTRESKVDAERAMSAPGTVSATSAPPAESPKSSSFPDAPASPNTAASEKRSSVSTNSHRKSLDDGSNGNEKKRRSSGVAKASALFATAKNSLHIHSSSPSQSSPLSPQQSALQKLGRTDPALSVPQGSHNNSAGESHPGPRSTFRVGVAEDRNKKCRRTMEDTHAYLYNFLSTPAPVIGSDASSNASRKQEELDKSLSTSSHTSQVVETDNGYFAVFDGHAGTFAADWCGKKLHLILEDLIRKNPNSPIPELLDQTFTSVDTQLTRLPLKNSGCTAITAVLRWEDRIPTTQSATGSTSIAPIAATLLKAQEAHPSDNSNSNNSNNNPSPALPSSLSDLPSKTTPATTLPKLQETASRQRVLYTANVGDARIVLCRSGKALRLSYDHKGSDENEGRRITNAGGLILNNRVNGVLAVTRALGDAYMKDLVTGHPYTTETVIQPDLDEFLILACDGLWDVCSDQEAVDLIRSDMDPQSAAQALVQHALARFSTDNLSCMVVRFDGTQLHNIIEQKVEPIGVEGDPATVAVEEKGFTGISEADGIVKESRRLMDLPDGQKVTDSEVEKISKEILAEQEQKESGPELELDPSKVEQAKLRAQKGKEKDEN